MEGYFKLAQQFHTQAEPSYCGLGSLVCALNASRINPIPKSRRTTMNDVKLDACPCNKCSCGRGAKCKCAGTCACAKA
jgi:hypothetical protein